MKWLKSCALVLTCLCYVAESASILALFSSLAYSDHLVFRGLVSRLTQKGHNVVMMTPYPGHFTYPEIEKIVELDVGQESHDFWAEWVKLVTNTDDHYSRLRSINEFSVRLAIAQLKSKQMTALLINPNIKFDLVITEADVPVLYGAAEKYKAPHIAITASSGKIHQHETKGNAIHPLFYPHVITLNYKNLTLWQKLVEFKRFIQTRNEHHDHYLPLCEIAAQNIFGSTKSLKEAEEDIDLLFVSANPMLVGNRPTVPAVIYTDRLHIKSGLILPQNLQATLDAATKGVIYFSIGAVQESEALNPRLLQVLADTFRDLPFTVLWKIGNTTAFEKPDNVIAGAWFPQQQILAHPNVKAFITHGGPRSLEEAVFYEVPIIGLPILQSRRVFIKEVTKYGAGEILDPYKLEKEELKTTITAVVTDEKYKQAITKLKTLSVDPIVSGPEEAVWWTEYVLRNGGARHLRSPAVGLTFNEYYLLDVISILLVGGLLGLWATYILLRFVVRRVRGKFFARPVELGGKFKSL